MSYSLVGAAAVLLFLLVAFDLESTPGPGPSLEVAREVQAKALTGETVSVATKVTNRGDRVGTLRLVDRPPPGAKVVRGSTTLLSSLPHGATATLRYELRFSEPGEHEFGASDAEVSSVFRLAGRKSTVPSQDTVRVYPRLLRARLPQVRSRTFAWTGTTQSRYRGGKLDFMNIREYVPGDRLKDINWRASGRRGTNLVNEWEVEKGLDCVVVVDLFADHLPRVGDWSARGNVIEASYELANALMTSGNRVGMLIMGEALIRVKPGFGVRTLRSMVEGLVDSEEGSVWSTDFVEKFLRDFFRRQYLTRTGTLFFVSAGLRERLVSTVKALAGSGFNCNAVFVNTTETERSQLARLSLLSGEGLNLGARVARAELDWFENQFAGFSRVYEWSQAGGLREVRRRAR